MPNDTYNLSNAKLVKKDEFYTRYEDIESELQFYAPSVFEGKTLICNCDDPYISQFYKYFIQNFDKLRLKKLICSCYKEQINDLFNIERPERAFYVTYEGEIEKDQALDPNNLEKHYFRGDGSFSSQESIRLLDEADIVVTNPPFSLFRDFIKLMDRKQKQFIVFGNVNAISYKECFTMFEKGRMWLGGSVHSGDREFAVPTNYVLDMTDAKQKANGDIITKSGRIDANGNKFIRVKGVRWFTNIEYDELHRPLMLNKRYDASLYSPFDNFPSAINVDKTSDIPVDYEGVIGVPITFMDYYDPQRFEIIGNEYTLGLKGGRGYVNGKRMYSRIFIRNKQAI